MVLKSIKRELYLIPEIGGNSKSKTPAAADQIKINYSHRPAASEVRAALIQRGAAADATEVEHPFISNFVKSIDNLETPTDGKIKTIEELLAAKETVIIYLIVEIVEDLLNIGELDAGE